MEDKKPIFVDGLRFWLPREGAPDFVKGALSIDIAKLTNWLNNQTEDKIIIDLKVSRGGKSYAQLNTYKPNFDKIKGEQEELLDVPF
jgi:hypothetical protein